MAAAGPHQSARVGATVTLDGGGSSDVDGDALDFAWSFLHRPAGSQAVLADPRAIRPHFTLDQPGDYVVQLRIHAGAAESVDTVTVTTENSPPVANAGPDQTVPLGATVALDGGGSTDPDRDALSFRWALTAVPSNSTAALDDPTAVAPTFVADRPGTYVAQLLVHDGTADSAPATVRISTENSRPVADAGPAQTVLVGETVTLNGGGSTDADHDPLAYAWALLATPEESAAALNGADRVQMTFVPDVAGEYLAQLLVNDGALDSIPATVLVAATEPAPAVRPTAGAVASPPASDPPTADRDPAADPDAPAAPKRLARAVAAPLSTALVCPPAPDHLVLQNQTLTGATTFQACQTLTAGPDLTVAANGAITFEAGQRITLRPGFRVQAGGTVNARITSATSPTTGALRVTLEPAAARAAGAQWRRATTATWRDSGATETAVPAGDHTVEFKPVAGWSAPANAAVTVTAGATAQLARTYEAEEVVLPPDPETVAPPVNPTVATTTFAATEFLYTGANPIQTGVAPGTIEAKRAAVLRGRVLDRQNQPLPGVTITINNRPEFGQTLSRTDGQFDLAVNGGGLLTLNYARAGYLPAQRQVNVPWQDFALAPDVVLIPLDSRVTTIDLGSAAPFQVAQGNPVTDADGTRQATLLFPQGTTATMTLPDGTTQPLNALQVRATEYTVGPNGPQAMPAALPPTTAYTYAVELSVDEAFAAGARRVEFDQPIPFYVDNFIGFPTGIPVPLAYYDPEKVAWVPVDDGRVIQILSISGGVAQVDTTGDGVADNGAALGMTEAERQRLATLYNAGQSLSRMAITHFTAYDPNYGIVAEAGAKAPQNPALASEAQKRVDDQPSIACGSVIECENQTLGQRIPLVGTGLGLNYRSDRVPGRSTNTLTIPLSGASVPDVLKRIDLEIQAVGRTFTQSFPAAPNQTHTFTWDGLDAYGRTLQGLQPVTVRVGYVYDGFYALPPNLARTFGAASGERIPGDIPARQDMILWQVQQASMGTIDLQLAGLGGWSLDVHHVYDPSAQVLYQGDGSRRSANNLNQLRITTIAGTGERGYSGDEGPATQAALGFVTGIAVTAKGDILIGEGTTRIRQVSPNGMISTLVAGLGYPWGIAVAADDSVLFAELSSNRIRRLTPDGMLTTVAGTGERGYSGDEGPAIGARLNEPVVIAVTADGSVLFADSENHRIRRIAPDGTTAIPAPMLTH